MSGFLLKRVFISAAGSEVLTLKQGWYLLARRSTISRGHVKDFGVVESSSVSFVGPFDNEAQLTDVMADIYVDEEEVAFENDGTWKWIKQERD